MSRILIVDDENSIRETLSVFLRNAGHDAETAPDAFTACSMCEELEFDIVITDVIMPRMTGVELLGKIRAFSPATQVIIMTGEPTVDTAISAVQIGANDYLVKPVSKFDLLKSVSHAEKAKELYDEKLALERRKQAYQSELEHVVASKTQALSNAMQSIISLLATVVETRDPYTAGHQRRVGNLAAAISARMKMSLQTVETIRICGYIHDIGKISVPIEILCKPGSLSELEMALIREHSEKGHELLSHVNLPPIFSEVAYQHHERCNGSGYPRGLRQEEIMPEAQVIMVADVVEAMMSHRPYRTPLGLDKALDEIREHAGTCFNPIVVDHCCELFLSDNYHLEETEKIRYLF